MSRGVRGTLSPPPALRVWWVWLVPPAVMVAVFVSFLPPINSLERLVGGAIGLIIILLAARRPDLAILGLIIGLPFQNVALSQLYRWGGASSEAIVRPVATWKEALALGVVVAGIRGFRSARRRADTLDFLALAFVGIVLAYAMFPEVFAPDALGSSQARSLAFRSTAGFVLLLLGARHADLPERFLERAANVALGVGVVVAAISIYEFTFSDSFNDFIVNRVRWPTYQFDVLNVAAPNRQDIRFYGHVGGREFVRVGSVLLSPLNLGFYLLVPFAIAIERAVRNGLRSYSGAALGIIGAALIFSQTRAALLGAVVIAFVAFRPAAGRDWSRRVQFTFVLMIGLIIAVPGAVATGLSDRVTATTSGDEQSAFDHIDAFWRGVRVIGDEPLGLGLGSSAGAGQRFDAPTLVITENYYLQVGVEVGVLGMAVFVALVLVMLRRLHRAQLAVPSLAVAAVRGAALGLAVAAFFLHSLATIAVAWPFFALAGAAIGVGESRVKADAADERLVAAP
jgi:hypothetical protein